LNMVARGVSAFTRDINNGGNFISDEIRKRLGVPFEQAEAYKCGHTEAGAPPPQVRNIIETVVDSIAAEIQRSLDFYLATSGEAEIARIVLTGGTANIVPLAQAIERRARVPVEVFSPLERIVIEPGSIDPAVLSARSPQLAVALGLSMRKEKEKRS
jgi:type IV pilus assembly protein PilM